MVVSRIPAVVRIHLSDIRHLAVEEAPTFHQVGMGRMVGLTPLVLQGAVAVRGTTSLATKGGVEAITTTEATTFYLG